MPSPKPERPAGKQKAAGPPKGKPKAAPAAPEQPDGLYAQVHSLRRRKGASSVLSGLGVSVVIHLIALIIFAGMRFGIPYVERPVIKINTDIVDAYREEPVTVRSVINPDDQATAAEQGAALAKRLDRRDKAVPVMAVDPLELGGLELDLIARKDTPPSSDWNKGTDLTRKVRRTGDKDLRSAMGALVGPIIDTISKRNLTVAILFDGSNSLAKERGLLATQLKRTFDELRFAIVERQEKRLKWAVVSYGYEPKLVLKPTKDIKKVQKALNTMPYDSTGEENLVEAVNFCLTKVARKRDRLFVVIMTDEQGDDIGLKSDASFQEKTAIKRLAAACKKRKARVFILGRESYLQHAGYSQWHTNAKGERRYGYQHIGLPDCRREVPTPIHPCATASSMVPSGWGSFGLTLLARRTNGTFFIISSSGSQYKAVDLKPYEPEWIDPTDYDQRAKRSVFRRTVADVAANMSRSIGSWRTFRKKGDKWSDQQWKWDNHDSMLRDKVRWCNKSIERLVDLKDKSAKDKWSPKRWEANYDLTLAQCYKLKAMLMQHRGAVAQLMIKRPPKPKEKPEPAKREERKPEKKKPEKKRPKNLKDRAAEQKAERERKKRERLEQRWKIAPRTDDDEIIVLHYKLYPAAAGDTSVKLVEKKDELEAINKAKRALEIVIKKHAGTPWAEAARRDLNSFRPIKATAGYGPKKDEEHPRVGL